MQLPRKVKKPLSSREREIVARETPTFFIPAGEMTVMVIDNEVSGQKACKCIVLRSVPDRSGTRILFYKYRHRRVR